MERVLVLEDPHDQMDVVLCLLAADMDDEQADRVFTEVEDMNSQNYGSEGMNFHKGSEFFPRSLSKEATQIVLETSGMSEGDFPDAEIEDEPN